MTSRDAAGDRAAAVRRTLPAHFRDKNALADTAGVSWAGRDYATSPFPGDDGSAPAPLAAALAAVRAGHDADLRRLAAALRGTRLLVPIMAEATEKGTTAHGLTGDNGADMAMVSITAPDGTTVLPLFTSAAALSAWRTDARPVPVANAAAHQSHFFHHAFIAVQNAGVIHHLTQAKHTRMPQKRLQSICFQHCAACFHASCRYARRQHKKHVKRHIFRFLQHPLQTFRAKHVGNFMRVGKNAGNAV